MILAPGSRQHDGDFEAGNGRHDWIRTSDHFRVKEAL